MGRALRLLFGLAAGMSGFVCASGLAAWCASFRRPISLSTAKCPYDLVLRNGSAFVSNFPRLMNESLRWQQWQVQTGALLDRGTALAMAERSAVQQNDAESSRRLAGEAARVLREFDALQQREPQISAAVQHRIAVPTFAALTLLTGILPLAWFRSWWKQRKLRRQPAFEVVV
jgi:hypothetical protein